MIEDEKEREYHLNLILNNNIWNYLGFINFNPDDERKEIYNIGLFFRNCDSERSKYLDKMKKYNLNKDRLYHQIKKKTIVNIELIPKVNSILACLSSFEELKNELIKYSQDKKFQTIKLFVNFFDFFPEKLFNNEIIAISGLLSLKDIHIIFSEIFKLIEGEFSKNLKIEEDPKISDFDENLAKNKFLLKRQNGQIIQRLFFSVIEKKMYCFECSLTSYNFEYFKFLDIDFTNSSNSFSLNNKIFDSEIFEKPEKCSFCGKITKNKVEKKCIEFSKI
jgi:hypothetical protein